MRHLSILVASLALAAGPAYSQHSAAAPIGDRLMRAVKLGDLQAIVAANGHTVTETGGFGPVSLEAKTKDGLVFVLAGHVCEQPGVDGCLGLKMDVRYDDDGRATLDKINEVNLMYNFITASFGNNEKGEPTVFFSKYVIFDDGITFSNVQNNLANVLAIAPKAALVVYSSAE